MQTLESLKRRIDSAGDLHAVVRTMKALAAVNIRQYEKAVESLAEYNRTLEMGLHVLIRQRPPGIGLAKPVLNEGVGAVVFGSDQGMVGQFNEVILHHMAGELKKQGVDKGGVAILAVGMRILSRLQETGWTVDHSMSLPDSVGTITPAVQDLVLHVETWRSARKIDQVLLFFNRPVSAASYRPHSLSLLPVDAALFEQMQEKPWPGRAIPFFTTDWNRLFSALIREYLFVSAYSAFAQSLASENASRLASMQVAEKNIEDRLQQLRLQFHQRRQSAIDEELFDLVAGFEALQDGAT